MRHISILSDHFFLKEKPVRVQGIGPRIRCKNCSTPWASAGRDPAAERGKTGGPAMLGLGDLPSGYLT